MTLRAPGIPPGRRRKGEFVVLSVVLAVLAAMANATASVLQRKAARRQPDDGSLSVRLLWDLAHQPVWIGGISAIVIGFAFQPPPWPPVRFC
jgi:drug/metabolite transporter (DMT)-like permease